jgi:hypothetical protein
MCIIAVALRLWMQTGAPCNSQGPERVCTGAQPNKDGGSAITCASYGTCVIHEAADATRLQRPTDTQSRARARHGSSLGCASGASALARRDPLAGQLRRSAWPLGRVAEAFLSGPISLRAVAAPVPERFGGSQSLGEHRLLESPTRRPTPANGSREWSGVRGAATFLQATEFDR